MAASTLSKVRVADITFGRNNGRLIRLLKERGESIVDHDFEKVHEIEAKINERIRINYERLTTPNHAFIVFEEEEGMKIALRNNSVREYNLLGSPMTFSQPHSPTDIIWENRERTDMF